MSKVIRRLANVSQEEALQEFVSAYPGVKTEFPFEKETKDDVTVYVAKVITSEFPPSNDGGSDDGGSDDGPPKSDSSDSDSGDSKPKSKSDSHGGGNKEVVNLIHELAAGLGVPLVGGDPSQGNDPGMVPPPDNLDLPDVGAPPQGAPLPPPAHPGGGMGAGNSFSSTQLPDRFTAFAEDADRITAIEGAREAEGIYAGYQAIGASKRRAKFNGREQTIVIAHMQKR